MKKFLSLFYLLLIGIGSFANNPGEIDKKLIQSFKTTFPNAEKVTWNELPEAYTVSFENDGIRAKIIYRKNGSFVRLTRYYSERNLPFHVQYKIKEQYPDKKIFGVTEVSTTSHPDKQLIVQYYLKLEDAKNWITVRVDSDGNLAVVEKFRKG